MIILSIGYANGYLNVYQVTAQDENEYGYSRFAIWIPSCKKNDIISNNFYSQFATGKLL